MPLYSLECTQGCVREEFCHVPDERGVQTYICAHGEVMRYALSVGRGLTWFEEGRPRVIENLGHEPVVIRSHAEHQRAMKAAGVEWSTGWNVKKTGGWV